LQDGMRSAHFSSGFAVMSQGRVIRRRCEARGPADVSIKWRGESYKMILPSVIYFTLDRSSVHPFCRSLTARPSKSVLGAAGPG